MTNVAEAIETNFRANVARIGTRTHKPSLADTLAGLAYSMAGIAVSDVLAFAFVTTITL